MAFPKFDGWCERCRADGLEYAVMLYPIGPSHVARMCSNVECSDIANDDVQMDVLKTDIPRLQKFFPDPVLVLDESIFSDEECDCGCKEMLNSPPSANSTAALDPKDVTARHNASVTISSTASVTAERLQSTAVDIHEKAPSTSNINPSLELCSEEHRATMCQDTGISARSESTQVTAEPFGEPTVSIGDSAPTASLCTEPLVCVNSVKHVYRTSKTCDSTCDDVGQVPVGQVREPTNSICDSSSLCADFVWMDTEEPSINICDDVPLRADSNVCMDTEELTGNNCGGALLYEDSEMCKDTADPRINVHDSVSLCADSHVCRDLEEHVYRTPHNSTSTCRDAINATADKEKVHGLAVCDSVRTHPFSANTSHCMNRHKHVCRPCHAVHIPNAVVMATVTVATSSPGSRLDDLSIISHGASLSSEAETGKWNGTYERRTFYTSLMPEKVAVKVVASSERPSCPYKHASASDIRCSDVKQEGHVDKTSNICTLNRMGTVLKVKVVAASEGGPSFELSDNISTPMLLAPSDTNSWLELMPEELADEVNCAFSEDSHEMIEIPAVKSALAYGLKSTEEPIMLVSPSPYANTEKANVGPKNAISSPAASPLGFMECHLNHEHREGADVSSIGEGALRDLGKADASVCIAVDSAGSVCATENGFVEWTDEESIVKPVSTNRVTNSASSSVTVSDATNTEDKFFKEVCDMVSLNESSSTSLSTSSEEQLANSAAADNCTGEKGALSMIEKPEDYERADEIPKLPIPLQQLQVSTVVATNHDPIVAGVTTDLPIQPDESDTVQESCHEEEQRATVNVDWHDLTFSKDSVTTVPSVPNSSEASLTENFITGIEIEVSTTEPPEPLPKYADTENVITNHISSHLSCSMLGLHNRRIIESIIENFDMPSEANMSSTEPPEPSQKCGDVEYFITNPIPPLVSCSLFSSPNRSERSVLENLTTASEIEISSTEQPEPLHMCGDSESDLNDCVCPRLSCSPNSLQSGREADLPEQLKVVKEVPSVVPSRPSTKENQDTEVPVHCLKPLSLQNTSSELINSQSKNEASSPGNLMALNEALTEQTRISKEGEHTEAVVASSKHPSSPTVGMLPCLPSNSEAGSPEISVVIDGTMPVELPLSSKELWRSTENIGSHLNPDASPYVPCGLPSLEGKAERSLVVCPGPMNAALSAELTVSPLKGSSTIHENSADITAASTEYTSLLESLPNEQADTEGVHMHGENHLSNNASNWQSSPERAVGANKTHSLGLLEPSKKAHGGTTRKVIEHCEPSPAPNDVTKPSGLPSETRVSALGLVDDPLSASLHIAESMCNMKAYGHRNTMLHALRSDNLCTDTSVTQELPLQSSGLNVLRYLMLKGNAGGEAGHLSLTSLASPQPPIGSFDEMETPLPRETFNTTAKLATHAGDGSGNLQQCASVAMFQPSSSSYKPCGAKVREGVRVVSEVTISGSKSEKMSGTKIRGQAVVFSVSGIQKGVQNIVINLPSNIVSEGNTETAAVNLKGTRRHTRNTRMKRQVPPACADGAGASKLRKTKATEDKKSSEDKKSLPLEQKTSHTGYAFMNRLALINKALAVPVAKGGTTCTSGGTPKDSKINLRSRQRGTASANKAKQPRKSQQTLTQRGVKQDMSRKRKGNIQTEQVVPDILQPVLSPTSSEFGSVSSKPSQINSFGTSSDAASSNSTCKTGNSVWKSITSCKSAEEYVQLIKNCLFPMEETGSGFPGYHPVLATRPPYNGDKKPTVITPKRRRRNATAPLRQTTEAASADVNLELDRYVSELSGTTDTSQFNSVLSELFDCIV